MLAILFALSSNLRGYVIQGTSYFIYNIMKPYKTCGYILLIKTKHVSPDTLVMHKHEFIVGINAFFPEFTDV